MKIQNLTPETFSEIMNKYDEYLEKWILMYGTEQGFDTWFIKQIVKSNESI